MIRKILTYSFGEILVKGISFLVLPLYSYMILPGEYGTLGFLNSLVVFLPFIFTFYYLYAFVRFAVNIKPQRLISTYFYMGILLNIFYLFGALIVYYLFISYYNIALKYYIMSVLASASIFLFQILQMYYRSCGNAKQYLYMSSFYTLAGVVLNIVFLTIFQDNVFAMLLANLTLALLGSLVAYRVLTKYIHLKLVDRALILTILKYSIPLVPGAIALAMSSNIDKIVLLKYITKEELGIYVMALSIGMAMGYLGKAFFMGYQPIFYEKVARNESGEIQKQFLKNIIIVLLFLCGVLIAIPFVYKFINEKYMSGYFISFSVAMTYAIYTFSQMMELHLTYSKKTIWVSYVYGIGTLLVLIGLILCAPIYGVKGAIIVLFCSSAITSLIMYYVAQKIFYIDYPKRVILLFYSIIFLLWYLIVVQNWIMATA